MLTTTELSWIKNVQREFRTKFNKSLAVDFPSMKNIVVTEDISSDDSLRTIQNENIHSQAALRLYADSLYIKYGISEEDVINRRKKCPNTREMLIEYSKRVMASPWNVTEAAKLIRMDRALIYHYADTTHNRKRGRPRKEYVPKN